MSKIEEIKIEVPESEQGQILGGSNVKSYSMSNGTEEAKTFKEYTLEKYEEYKEHMGDTIHLRYKAFVEMYCFELAENWAQTLCKVRETYLQQEENND